MLRNAFLALIALSALASNASATTLQCAYVPQLFDIYLKYHYSQKSLSDELKVHVTEQYVKSLDSSKTMLLEKDVEAMKASLANVFATMKTGNCASIEEAAKVVLARANENLEFVKTFLGKDYKLDENASFILDPRKRSYPKTLEERQDILRKMVHFQISNYLLADSKLPEAKKNLIHRYELVVKRLKEDKMPQMLENYLEAFALALDPHSSYLSKDSMEDFQIQMQLSLEGIGASLTTQDGFTVIDSLIAGGSADRSGVLKPKDKILSVAQEGQKPVNIMDMELRDVVKLIRGKKGTKVVLTILRQSDTTTTFDATIVRDKIDIKEQAAKYYLETRKVGTKEVKIGILDLPSFYGDIEKNTRSSSEDVKKLLLKAKKDKVQALILNLSKNGGGLLDEAVKISGLFMARANVVATKDSKAKVETLADEDEDVVYPGPLFVLTSPLSASASEILAGALKDYRRAVIVGGEHTFGKGSVQIVSGLPLDLGGLKVTTGMFFLPGGVSTQLGGVPSDIVLPTAFSTEDLGEKMLDYPLGAQAIKPFLSAEANKPEPASHWEPVKPEIVQKLIEKSTVRVAKDPKFLEIKKNLEEAAKTEGTIKLADIRKKSKVEKTQEKTKKKKAKGSPDEEAREKDLDSALVQEGINIASDLVTME